MGNASAATVGPDLQGRLKTLPVPVKQLLKRASRLSDPVQVWLYRRRTGDRRPIPPAVLRTRVGGSVRIAEYVGDGFFARDQLEAALADRGLAFTDLESVYDWGCGCGRILGLMLGQISPGTRLIGSDVDAEAVAWVARTWPEAEVMVNDFTPPLPVDAGCIHCLYSSSILTHLTEPDQDAWLAEIRRVLRPDGLALITVAGTDFQEMLRTGTHVTRSAAYSERLRRLPPLAEHGFLFEPYDRRPGEEADFPGIAGDYGMALHHPDYVRDHWSRWFDVLDHRPAVMNGGQDLVVVAPRA